MRIFIINFSFFIEFPKAKVHIKILNFGFLLSVSTILQSLLNSDEAIHPKKKVEKICDKKENVIMKLKFMYLNYTFLFTPEEKAIFFTTEITTLDYLLLVYNSDHYFSLNIFNLNFFTFQ